jgi:pimeloyl-ACP methyl ester carboxylesterase
MWPLTAGSVLLEECPVLRVPVFIFDGVHDNNTPAALVEDYFNSLRAPKKELHWFENSGHNPMGDEPEKFKRLLREKLTEITSAEKAAGAKI